MKCGKFAALSLAALTILFAFTLHPYAKTETQQYQFQDGKGSWNTVDGGTVIITSYIPPSYQVRIPANMTVAFGNESTAIGAVVVEKANLESGARLNIMVSDNRRLLLEQDQKEGIPFQLRDALRNSLFTGMIFQEGQPEGTSCQLQVDIAKADWDNAKSGKYGATLSFSIAYEKG